MILPVGKNSRTSSGEASSDEGPTGRNEAPFLHVGSSLLRTGCTDRPEFVQFYHVVILSGLPTCMRLIHARLPTTRSFDR